MKKWKCKLVGHKWKEMRIEDKENKLVTCTFDEVGRWIATEDSVITSKLLKCSKCGRQLEKCKRCGMIKCDCGVG